MHYRNLPGAVCRIPQMLSHPSLEETTHQTLQTSAAEPAWPWRPSSQGGSLEVDPVVWEVDENFSTESMASVRRELVYNRSGEAVAGVPARSPRPALPAHPPGSPVLAGVAAVMTPHMADSHQ